MRSEGKRDFSHSPERYQHRCNSSLHKLSTDTLFSLLINLTGDYKCLICFIEVQVIITTINDNNLWKTYGVLNERNRVY